MQLKVFVVPLKNIEAMEPEMNAFLGSHRVLTVRKEFVRAEVKQCDPSSG